MFQLIILTLFINLPITPMPSESVVLDGIRGNRPIVAPGKVNWWRDSALPGEGSNVVLYGHSDNPFGHLHNIKPGAVITIAFQGDYFRYEVTKVFAVNEADGRVKAGRWIDPTPAERLTLVTCVGEDRLIVIATP